MKKIILFVLTLVLVLPTVTLAQDDTQRTGRWCIWNCAKKGMSFGYHKYPPVNPFNLSVPRKKPAPEAEVEAQLKSRAEVKLQEKETGFGAVAEKNKIENEEIIKLKKEIEELKKQKVTVDKKVEKNIQTQPQVYKYITQDTVIFDILAQVDNAPLYQGEKVIVLEKSIESSGSSKIALCAVNTTTITAENCTVGWIEGKYLSDNKIEQKPTTKVATQQVTTYAPPQNTTLCNGKSWLPCPTGQEFFCPTIGDAQCLLPKSVSSNTTFCNGISYNSCPAGQTFSCPTSGTAKCLLPELTLAEKEAKGFVYADERGWSGLTITYKGEKLDYIKENGVWIRENDNTRTTQNYTLPTSDRINEIKNFVNDMETKQKECEAKKQADIDAENNNPNISEELRGRKVKNIMDRQCIGGSTYSFDSNSSSNYQSYTISPDGIGGYKILDNMNFNSWRVYDNGMGGWNISSY